MKFSLFVLMAVSFSVSAFAFPNTALQFTCPNSFSGSVTNISLGWNSAQAIWTGSLIESFPNGVSQTIDGIEAKFFHEKNRMEISHRQKVIALMSQSETNGSIYRDGKFVLNCTF